VANFRRQLERAGLMVDWRYVVDTSRPEYYKWTQWVFLQLLKAGLAYKKKAAVNWCPKDKTVLANEQVIGGACERCGTPVEQRFLEQWFFRITQYAERLLNDLDWLDWSETTKTAQRNWIGRSEGARVDFLVPNEGQTTAEEEAGASDNPMVMTGTPITVFTTRPDTIFGATYLVLAPEHPLVERITTPAQRAAVEEYRTGAAKKDLVARKTAVTAKEKTGVFTGAYAHNPATNALIPIWVADYVLMDYGTGAIMAVPGHDERDFEFATQFALPIVRVVAAPGDSPEAPLAEAYTGDAEGDVLVNSGRFDGQSVPEGKQAIVAWLQEMGQGQAVTNYRLHDWTISRQRYWGPPIPVIYCDRCGTVPVPEDQLPVELPFTQDFKPDDTGVSPLARVKEWYEVPCPQCGTLGRRETDVSDTFLDSAWYFLRYPSADRDDVPFDAALTKKWLPVDSYIGGNEHAVLHLLYSRFVTMVLHDMGHIDFDEPYRKFRAHGLLIRDGAKMSKSKGNVVNPDQYMEQWGADTLRTYLMFLGPYEEGGDFRDASISGVRRFLDRVWASVRDMTTEGAADPAVLRKLHQTIRKVGDDLPKLSYNTAIAAMMEYVNVLRKAERTPHRDETMPLVQLVASFAPYLAEELWERGGGEGASVFDAGWPVFDASLAAEDEIELVVQVNGKLRGRIRVSKEITQADALAAARRDDNIAKFVTGEPKKVIFVPGRLLNLVV
jgi:leucyl-tRNA synthetase